MIMRYYGGGIGHMNNTPTQQADPLDPPTDEMAEDDAEEDTGGTGATWSSDTSKARQGRVQDASGSRTVDESQPEDVSMHEAEQGVDENDEIDGSGDNANNSDDSETDADSDLDNYDYEEDYYRENVSESEGSDSDSDEDYDYDYNYEDSDYDDSDGDGNEGDD